MQSISLSAEKAQRFTVTLGGVQCTLRLYQRDNGMFIDLYVGNDTAVCLGVTCMNAVRIVRYDYLRAKTGFKGDLFFIDTTGSGDPYYAGLGDRYKLYYVTDDELSEASS